jgi:hypothetical protein
VENEVASLPGMRKGCGGGGGGGGVWGGGVWDAVMG